MNKKVLKKLSILFTFFHLLTVFNLGTLPLIIFINRSADLFCNYKLLKSIFLCSFENLIPVLLKLFEAFELKYYPGPIFNLLKIGLCLFD